MSSRTFRAFTVLGVALLTSGILFLDLSSQRSHSEPPLGPNERAKTFTDTSALAGVRPAAGKRNADYVHERRAPQVLLDDLSRLEQRATAGDAEAASTLASYSNHCNAIQNTTRVMDTLLDQDVGAMSEDQRTNYDRDLERVSDLFEQYSDMCLRAGHRLFDERPKILLRASKLGDGVLLCKSCNRHDGTWVGCGHDRAIPRIRNPGPGRRRSPRRLDSSASAVERVPSSRILSQGFFRCACKVQFP